ncbi:subunit B of DNA polymerase alpha [Chloropicon primus]|nr:subunit B of DNA polymerase alpha [Chloropicon primus]
MATTRRAFEAQGMTLKDEMCVKLAARVSGMLGIGDMMELAEEYEVFHINRGESSNVVTTELLEAFKDHLQRQRSEVLSKKKRAGGWHTYASMDLDDVSVSLDRSFSKVQTQQAGKKGGFAKPGPVAQARSSKRASDAPETQAKAGSTFSKRARSGTDFASLVVKHKKRPDAEEEAEGAPKYSKVLDEDTGARSLLRGPGTSARFMYDTAEAKAALVDERIQRLVDLLETRFGIDASNSVYGIANEPVVVCGRICCDSAEGRINEASILIEGSSLHSQGMKVRLDTSKLSSLSLFPGQVVAVEGINPSGHCITAFGILTGVPKPLCAAGSSHRALGRAGDRSRRVVVASGPFTTVEDLSLEPLKALIESASEDKPDFLVLNGPFVDKDHPIVKAGQVDVEFEDLFDLCCESFRKLPRETKVVLVPSVRDVHHDPAYPQPPFRTNGMPGDVREKIICAPNPAVVSCSGVTIGATSHDILKHLSGSELHRSSSSSDRMARLASHVLQQRNFYPLSPPAPGTCLDSKLASEKDAIFLPNSPDVLVLPSDLNPFAREVSVQPSVHTRDGHVGVFSTKIPESSAQEASCICVNPGRLAKGPTGGTFCLLDVTPSGELEKATIRRI